MARRGMGLHPGASRLKAKGGRRFPANEDQAYLAFAREHDCAIAPVLYNLTQQEVAAKGFWPCGTRPERHHNEAAHVVGTKGAGNVHDRGSVCALCPVHHDEQEGRTKQMNAKYGVDLQQLAADYLADYTRIMASMGMNPDGSPLGSAVTISDDGEVL
jgi:hypothetical protein